MRTSKVSCSSSSQRVRCILERRFDRALFPIPDHSQSDRLTHPALFFEIRAERLPRRQRLAIYCRYGDVVAEADLDLLSVLHDMMIRDDMPLFVPQEAGTAAFFRVGMSLRFISTISVNDGRPAVSYAGRPSFTIRRSANAARALDEFDRDDLLSLGRPQDGQIDLIARRLVAL